MSIHRRDFLKAAPVAAGAAALAATVRDASAASEAQTPDIRIGAEPYSPVRDYPIRAVPYSDVTLTDTFWKPKVDLNASVTIPFEVEKRKPISATGHPPSRRRTWPITSILPTSGVCTMTTRIFRGASARFGRFDPGRRPS